MGTDLKRGVLLVMVMVVLVVLVVLVFVVVVVVAVMVVVVGFLHMPHYFPCPLDIYTCLKDFEDLLVVLV